MGKACSTHWEEEKFIQDIDGKARRKETLGRPRCRWVNDIKTDLGEIGLDGMD
jgi:hypothetical protein